MQWYHVVHHLVWMLTVQQLTFMLTVSCAENGAPKRRSRLSTRSVLLNEEAAAALYAVGASTEADSYQGLVGRPGIDFPVLTQIPRTVFDCKNHGNGYFADLETRCQVFHICDAGKKISFLCPNGTIFRQLDLICDWWFKVDCAATPNHYAESTEMLTQAKRARLQSKHPVPQPINPNDERLTTSIQDKRLLLESTSIGQRQPTHRTSYPSLEPIGNVLEFNRRMDLLSSVEIEGDRGAGGRRSRDRKGARKVSLGSEGADEIQDTAQSASFATVAQKMFNSYYAHDKPSKDASASRSSTGNNQARSEQQQQADEERSTSQDVAKDASAKGYGNNRAVNYIPYTTARKLNLSGKVTQFYTPTVPTFTTSTKTTATTVAETSAATATTKATTLGLNGEAAAGEEDRESHQRDFGRRSGVTIDESVMDHAMEIMQTIKSLKIEDDPSDGANANRNGDGGSAGTDYQVSPSPPLPASLLASSSSSSSSSLPVVDSVEFVLQSAGGSEANADRFRRMRLGDRKVEVPVGHRSLLTRTTLNEYDRLFRQQEAGAESVGNSVDSGNLTYSDSEYYADATLEHDLEGQSSRYPVFGMSNSSQIRELAQIFTHALSAYLQDPVTFRRILTEIRPKAPASESSAYLPDTRANELQAEDRPKLGKYTADQELAIRSGPELASFAPPSLKVTENAEVLDYSDVTTTTTQSPTETTTTTTVVSETTAPFTSTTPSSATDEPQGNSRAKQGKSLSIQFITGARNELADEVNGELGTPALVNNDHGYADHGSYEERSHLPQATTTLTPSSNDERLETTKQQTATTIGDGTVDPYPSVTTEQIPSPRPELTPPDMPSSQYRTPKTTQPLDDDEQLQRAQSEAALGSHHQRPIYERNQYSIIQLSNLQAASSPSATASSPPQTTVSNAQSDVKSPENEAGLASNGGPPSRTTMSYTVFFDPLTINDELMELDRPKPTVSHQPRLYGWNGTLLSAAQDSSATGTPESARLVMRQPENAADMQQKANEMFGDLNDAQADRLMSAMKMADKDKSMRRLILLLIRTCDDDPSTANEESRKALLDALINIDGVQSAHAEQQANELLGGQGQRRGKTLGADGARILYDGPVQQNVPNYTATTENYATVAESSHENESSEGAGREDTEDSDEVSKENTFPPTTTVATTRVYSSSSSETRLGYQSQVAGSNEIRGRWANEYGEAPTTTTPLPTTFFQTTTVTGSTGYTTTEPTTITTATSPTTSGSDYGSPSSTVIGTTTTATTNRAESFESDPSLELQPPLVVSQRLPKDLSSSLDYPGSGSSQAKKHTGPHFSDTRALELLKSLYSLAARWG